MLERILLSSIFGNIIIYVTEDEEWNMLGLRK